MAPTTKKEVAERYLERLKETRDVFAEGRKIARELDGLTLATSQKKLSRDTKTEILLEIKKLAMHEEAINKDKHIIVACDNSSIIDVIDYLMGKLEG